jgi:tetratricopeptide (TPR) repeat protein
LGDIERNRGNWDTAIELYQNSLKFKENLMGADHPEVADLLASLGSLYQRQESYEDAETYYLRALEIRKHKLGLGHPETKKIRMVLDGIQQIKGNPSLLDFMTSVMSLMQQKPELVSAMQQKIQQKMATFPEKAMESVFLDIFQELAETDIDLKNLMMKLSQEAAPTAEI